MVRSSFAEFDQWAFAIDQRRRARLLSEIQTLEWRHVDLDQKELRLPDSKTGAKTVHLGDAAVSLLKDLPRVTGLNGWRGGTFVGIRSTKSRPRGSLEQSSPSPRSGEPKAKA